MKLTLRPAAFAAALALLSGFTSPGVAGAASGIQYVQSATVSTGARVGSASLKLRGAVAQGDLLVGWFAQYDTAGQVHVSDNVNGAWSRAGSELFTNNKGDVALYFKAGAVASPGLTITVSADAPAYLLGTASEYSGVPAGVIPDAVGVGKGNSASADSGSTAAVAAGELVYGALITGGNPAGFTLGSSQGVSFVKRASNLHGTAGSGDVLSSAAGAQHAGFALGAVTNWYAVAAVFPRATTTAPPASPAVESLTVPFKNGTTGVTTSHSYSGPVQIHISGTGQAAGSQYSDAFYIYADASGRIYIPPVHPSTLYDWTLWLNGGPADRLTAVPAYESDHDYTFTFNAPGGRLTFAVGDSGTYDNSGQYLVTISAAG